MTTNPEDRIGEAVAVALSYRQIDGAHHKMWVIDQMVRKLLGPEPYEQMVREYEETQEDGEPMYEWETGGAP